MTTWPLRSWRLCRTRLTTGKIPVVCLTLLVLMPGCRPDPSPGSGSEPEASAVAVQDSGDVARQVAGIDLLGPGAGTDRTTRLMLGGALGSIHKEVAQRAAYWLAQAGRPAVPILLASLRDTSTRTRTGACYALGLLGSAAGPAVPALIRQLAGESDPVADMADWALTQIDTAGTARLLREVRALRYGTPQERVAAATSLGLRAGAAVDAIPILVRALADPDGSVVEEASEALVLIGPGSTPALQVALLSNDSNLRSRALLVVSRIRPYSHF